MTHRRSLDVGVIGFGPIGRRVATKLTNGIEGINLTALLVRPRDLAQAEIDFGSQVPCTSLDAFIARQPQIAVECASSKALGDWGAVLMERGIDVMPLSLVAFSDPVVERKLVAAAEAGPGRLEIPAGAIGALGLLAAGRHCGLHRAVLRATYPPSRWQSMGAGPLILEAGVPDRVPFFTGTVRETATRFPGHLNVAVAVALAGIGMDRTQVELCSDASITQATFQLSVWTDAGDAVTTVLGRQAPVDEDPLDFTTFSLLRQLERRVAGVAC